jgi:kinesin family protein 5
METVSTLRFGMRAKNIENKVTANATRSVEELEALLIKAEKAIDTQTEHIVMLNNQVQDLLNGGTGEGIVRTMNDNILANGGDNNEKMSIMEDNYNQLAQDFEEEKSEGIRKDAEMIGLTTILREKERLLIEASDLLLEAQKHYENQREKTDNVSREKSNALGEIEKYVFIFI